MQEKRETSSEGDIPLKELAKQKCENDIHKESGQEQTP